jgi:hypothetical protein
MAFSPQVNYTDWSAAAGRLLISSLSQEPTGVGLVECRLMTKEYNASIPLIVVGGKFILNCENLIIINRSFFR